MVKTIEQDLLKELYDYQDGFLINRFNINPRAMKGEKAGCLIKTTGYTGIRINSKRYSAHRLIWIWHNGDIPKRMEIDHINRNRGDDRIENLRLATHQENMFNSFGKGCFWNKSRNKWHSQISINDSIKYLGSFDNEQEAHQAYLNAKEKYHQITQH
jgi:hypothetical protein